jgi:hypothetical protein
MLTHKQISFIKSGIRFVGYAIIFAGKLPLGALFLGLAEGVGVYEEMGQNG